MKLQIVFGRSKDEGYSLRLRRLALHAGASLQFLGFALLLTLAAFWLGSLHGQLTSMASASATCEQLPLKRAASRAAASPAPVEGGTECQLIQAALEMAAQGRSEQQESPKA
jgi:hypothetical protein